VKTIHEIDLTDVAIEKQLDISQLAPGLYFITIEGVQGMITKRLIKQ
jgi:hypothetical protein